jgi:hypothetical protein
MSHEGRELHEIVSNYGFPVFVSDEFDTIITWNGSNTFLFWAPLAEDARTGEWIAGGYRRPKKWSNTDLCTINAVGNVRNAESLAKIWHENLLVSTDDE